MIRFVLTSSKLKKLLIFILIITLIPKIGFTKAYKADFYYPSGDGPFPVVIMSHGKGGPSVTYHKKAEGATRNGRAAIVLDHYSARGEYGRKFRNFPKTSDGKKWREKDLINLLKTLKDKPKINRKKIILIGWSAGAGMVLPFISKPNKIQLPEDIFIIGAILTYPYTYGCYQNIKSFDVPVLINYGKLDGNDGNPLSGYFCWKDKLSKLDQNNFPVVFNEYENAYHGYDLPFLKNRPKICTEVQYRDGKGQSCMEFNESAFRKTIIANKKFINRILKN